MARVHYYDTSTSTSNWNIAEDTSADTTCSSYLSVSTQQIYVREILVKGPENWEDNDYKEYINLVNNKVRTGWTIKYLIKGDILITDPNIETREMRDFIPLLKWRTSKEDLAKIDQFFEKHKI